MALYFYFNTTTRDLVYSNKAIYDVEGYTSLGEQVNLDPNSESDWVFHSHRITIVTVSKDKSIVGKIAGLTSMGYMFSRCGNLASLDLSGLDTSAVTNMGNMFYGCTKLTSLDVSGFDTSAVTNMNHMFDSCTKLTSIDLSGFDTSAVTSMVSMFYNCNALTDLDLSSFDTSDVTDMRTMFNKCTGLISLDISYFDTSSVTSMYNMFSGCNNLISLDVSGFDTSAVTDMRNMFASCSSLTSLDLSGFDSSTVTSMSGMFYSCARLTSLDLSSFDTLAVTDTSSMFIGCNSLRLITISDKMSNALSQLPADQYYPAAGGSPIAKADLTAGTWVRDEADLTKVTSLVQQAQMSQAISRRIGVVRRDLEAQIREASALLDQLDFAAGGLILVENGGTGATTAAQARTNLGITPANIGAATTEDVQGLQDSLSQLSVGVFDKRVAMEFTIGNGSSYYFNVDYTGLSLSLGESGISSMSGQERLLTIAP